MTPYMEFLSRLPQFLSRPSLHHDKTPEIKIKQTTNIDIHDTQMLSSTCSPCMRARVGRVSQSITPTRVLTLYGPQTDTHIRTHVSIHRPAQLCRTPPVCSVLPQSFAVLSVILLGVGVLFVCLGEKSEGERQMERRSEEKEEMEALDGPQLVRAIVSMTCSSLLLSLCLLACSSRSKADKISSLYLMM